jgi:NRAMP (natural resistance-associated macrophage protein)-like metal ion transporter
MSVTRLLHRHGLRARRRGRALLQTLGPGLIAGAADDDPSGIATYSQAGAQFGLGMLWTAVLTFPLMVGIQMVSARIGRVTGLGVAANLRAHYPPALVILIAGLLLVANVINLGADLAAMAAAMQLVAGGNYHVYVIGFATFSLLLQVFVPFPRYSPILKLLTLSLLAYAGTLFFVHVDWWQVLARSFTPTLSWEGSYVAVLVAVLGTTISPYLFFWQAGQEVEELHARERGIALKHAPETARQHLRRIKIDTYLGMGFSNLVALFIMVATAVTLNAHGVTDIQTTRQAAEALRPLAGEQAFWLFSLGIVGTGLLAVPVLAGSAAYAVGEALGWRSSLAMDLRAAKGFYGIIAAAMLVGVALDFNDADPIRELYWSATINGVIAVPIMAVMMLLGQRADVMGEFVVSRRLRVLGWLATAVMAAAVVAMFAMLL